MSSGNAAKLVVLATDFGVQDPYIAQMQAAVYRYSNELRVVSLFSDLPNYAVQAAAYLLPAYSEAFPAGSVFVCVIDPGVGGERLPLALEIGEHWFVGPDNGLFTLLMRRSAYNAYQITWRPEKVSHTFHGRDLFAPMAARLALGERSGLRLCQAQQRNDWPDELPKVVYSDHYGNLITGTRASGISHDALLELNGNQLPFAPYFSAVSPCELFWYENANGLVEIAANQASARELLNISIGQSFSFVK